MRPSSRSRCAAGAIPTWCAWLLAVVVLLVSGWIYRRVSARIVGPQRGVIELPIPLRQLPTRIGAWRGEDAIVPTTTEDYMRRHFADDFVSRHYRGPRADLWVDVYVVYCASRPAGILGHKPSVCYPANGWMEEGTTESEVETAGGRTVPCLIHRFSKRAPTLAQRVVLSFYVVNGRIVTNEREFSGLMGRAPNLEGNPARYVAQVQLGSVVENSVRVAGKEMIELILAYLPDEDGQVRASVGDGGRKEPTS